MRTEVHQPRPLREPRHRHDPRPWLEPPQRSTRDRVEEDRPGNNQEVASEESWEEQLANARYPARCPSDSDGAYCSPEETEHRSERPGPSPREAGRVDDRVLPVRPGDHRVEGEDSGYSEQDVSPVCRGSDVNGLDEA